jgi:hypothetical protein
VTVAIAVVVLLGDVTIDLVDLRIAGPVLVLALGLALLLGGGRDRSDPAADTSGGTSEPADTTGDTSEPVDEVADASGASMLDLEDDADGPG